MLTKQRAIRGFDRAYRGVSGSTPKRCMFGMFASVLALGLSVILAFGIIAGADAATGGSTLGEYYATLYTLESTLWVEFGENTNALARSFYGPFHWMVSFGVWVGAIGLEIGYAAPQLAYAVPFAVAVAAYGSVVAFAANALRFIQFIAGGAR